MSLNVSTEMQHDHFLFTIQLHSRISCLRYACVAKAMLNDHAYLRVFEDELCLQIP